jgi:chromosome segregation ATPase
MAELSELKKKADDLMRRYSIASKKRSELKGQLEAVKAELASLADEIRSAGYDPKTLKADRDKAHKELEDLIQSFDQELTEVESAIRAFEEK